MPGLDEKDIQITLNDNLLTIQGEKPISKKDERKNYITREINYGQYLRSIYIPLAVDADKVTTSFKKGMLWITLPKKTAPTRVDIKKIDKACERLSGPN